MKEEEKARKPSKERWKRWEEGISLGPRHQGVTVRIIPIEINEKAKSHLSRKRGRKAKKKGGVK